MAFQPEYAAYLNLIEPWWKILRSLALAGQRFETWDEITDAIRRSTAYWNAHRHPFVWGQRCHRPRRSPGIALLPRACMTYRMNHLDPTDRKLCRVGHDEGVESKIGSRRDIATSRLGEKPKPSSVRVPK